MTLTAGEGTRSSASTVAAPLEEPAAAPFACWARTVTRRLLRAVLCCALGAARRQAEDMAKRAGDAGVSVAALARSTTSSKRQCAQL